MDKVYIQKGTRRANCIIQERKSQLKNLQNVDKNAGFTPCGFLSLFLPIYQLSHLKFI